MDDLARRRQPDARVRLPVHGEPGAGDHDPEEPIPNDRGTDDLRRADLYPAGGLSAASTCARVAFRIRILA